MVQVAVRVPPCTAPWPRRAWAFGRWSGGRRGAGAEERRRGGLASLVGGVGVERLETGQVPIVVGWRARHDGADWKCKTSS